jgi:trimeric autotransporter adhesin
MKTKLSLSILMFTAVCSLTIAQVPQGFNYQAVARDGTGAILQNTPLQVMFYVQSLQTGGTLYWKEWHSSVTTNNFGLFNLVVGNGVRQTESTVATFDLIDWSVTPKYLKTEIYYSGSWKDLGTSQLMSVPYAMTSGDLVGTVDKLSVKGTTSGLEEALFEVKNKDGQTIFAVYNEGVRVYVSDGAKAVKGGFAVGGFGMDKAESTKYLFVGKDSVRIYLDTNPLTKKLKGGFAVGGYDLTKGIVVQDYLDVNSDSVRIYIDSNPATKKVKGGFAVGGYDMTKAKPEEYLRVTRDSSRIYVNNNPAKGLKGGFAVGGFDITKGSQMVTPFTSLTPENYFIGYEGGQKITSGIFNSTVGYQSGRFITSGESNAFLGYQSGYNNNTGTGNLFLGYQTGYSTTDGSYNSFVGYKSGYSNSTGLHNAFLGSFTGYKNTTGNFNTFVGDSAGFNNTIGNENSFFGQKSGYRNQNGANNVFIGTLAGRNNVSGDSCIFIGNRSGYNNVSGKSNIYIGNRSGYSCTTAQGNVFIGYYSGFSNTNGYSNLFIGFNAGLYNSAGYNNVFLGYKSGAGESPQINSNNTIIGGNAGQYITTGNANVLIGYRSGNVITDGSNNVFLGDNAGYSNHGNGNIFLGHRAGYYESGDNILLTDNQMRSNQTDQQSKAMFYGQFNPTPTSQYLRINAKVGIGGSWNTSYALYVTGDIVATGSMTATNFIATMTGFGAYKYNTSLYMNIPDYVFDKYFNGRSSINPVYEMLNMTDLRQFINKNRHLPGVPSRSDIIKDGAVNLQGLSMVTLEKVEENTLYILNLEQTSEKQQNIIDNLQQQIESYKSQLQSLQEKVDRIETMLAKSGWN